MRFANVGLAVGSALLASALASAPAHGQPQPNAARLEVDAAPSCSTRDELVARVTARSTRIRFVNDGAGVPSLAARIEPGPRGAVIAELTVTEPDGRKFARRIEAPSCAAATDALALVVAITLDPSATSGETSGSPAGAAPGAEPGAPPATPPPGPQVTPSEPPEPPGDRGDATRDTGEAAIPSVGRVSAGVAAQVVAGPAPIPMPGIALEATAALDRASIASPAIVLTLAHVWSNGFKAPAGATADFALDLVGLDACPVRLMLAALEARACASGTLGRLAAQGSNAYEPRSVTSPFVTAGGTLRLAVPFGARVEVRARVGVAAPIWRDAFEFTPGVFHRVASVTLVADLGIGVRFP